MRSMNLVRVLALAALGFATMGASPARADERLTPGRPDYGHGRIEGATLAALQAGYQAEMNARLHYLLYARIAAREGRREAERLFHAIASAESIHAANHAVQIARLGGVPRHEIQSVVVGNTAANLRRAIEVERLEHTTAYRERAKFAELECEYDALASLTYARDAERTHEQLFRRALTRLEEASGPTLLASLTPVVLAPAPGPVGPVAVICQGCGSAFECRPGRSCPNCGTSCSTMRCFGILRP